MGDRLLKVMCLNDMVKKIVIGLMVCALSCILILPVSASVIVPEEYDFNINCEDLGYVGYALNIDASPWQGVHIVDGAGSVTIEMINDTHFNFTTSGILIYAVVVKGGDGTNVYNYSGSSYGEAVTSDTVLGTRLNPNNNKFYDISHIDFCYKITPPSTTPSSVPEFPVLIVPVFVVINLIACAVILHLVRDH